jgi:hypothetical protein
VATGKERPGTGYDLVCMFDCLHDMGDPVGAARRIRHALAPDGTLLLIEPLAGDGLADNLNPVRANLYGLSTVICTLASLAQEVGVRLGAQAGELHLGIVLREAGFTRSAPGDRNPVQRHPGGTAIAAIGVAPIAASADWPRARSASPMKMRVLAHW